MIDWLIHMVSGKRVLWIFIEVRGSSKNTLRTILWLISFCAKHGVASSWASGAAQVDVIAAVKSRTPEGSELLHPKSGVLCVPKFLELLAFDFISCSYPQALVRLGDAAVPYLARAESRAKRVASERAKSQDTIWVSDLMCGLEWQPYLNHPWNTEEHVNLLESREVKTWTKSVIKRRKRGRAILLLDSKVSILCGRKGRSSSRKLNRVWVSTGALQVAGNLYPGMAYGRSASNRADASTRNYRIPPPSRSTLPGSCSRCAETTRL